MKTLLIYFAQHAKLFIHRFVFLGNTKTLKPLPAYWAIIPVKPDEIIKKELSSGKHNQ